MFGIRDDRAGPPIDFRALFAMTAHETDEISGFFARLPSGRTVVDKQSLRTLADYAWERDLSPLATQALLRRFLLAQEIDS